MVRKKTVSDDSPTIAFRVNTPLYEWIKQRAVDGESPHQVVKRLVGELAASDGVVFVNNKKAVVTDMSMIDDRIDARVNRRFMELEAVMEAFADDVKRLKRDVGSVRP